ncbi:ATP-grasp domain-containing protein [Atopobacter phocae]|uniref:ATP-grasp domain-containing protein n=1 Tax=Atopobacter phocae TaxID=136492 RepID=UPI00046E6965|nr:ATP-grasp domain-containing protein [Atopobacter phocae]
MQAPILPGQTIGVIGGGHDGIGFTLEALGMGYLVKVYVENEADAILKLPVDITIGSYTDEAALKKFAEACDVVTYTTRKITSDIIESLKEVTRCDQNSDLLYLDQDAFMAKALLEAAGVLTPNYTPVSTVDEVLSSAEELGYPCILKTSQMTKRTVAPSVILRSSKDFDQEPILKIFEHGTAILETFIEDAQVLTLGIARNERDDSVLYPLVSLEEKNYEWIRSFVPAQHGVEHVITAQSLAEALNNTFQTVGLLSIKLLLSPQGTMYVLEASNRPRAWLDYSNKVTTSSHYHSHLRGIVGLPMIRVELFSMAISMPVTKDNIHPILMQTMQHDNWHLSIHHADETVIPTSYGTATVMSNKANELYETFHQMEDESFHFEWEKPY